MKEQLLPERIANDIRMARHARYHDKSFLLVEGPTDDLFYQRFVNIERCIIEVAHNKDNLLSVLDILEKSSVSGILAIVDTDFNILEGKSPASSNLLFTDTHDLETMILKSPALRNSCGNMDQPIKLINSKKLAKSLSPSSWNARCRLDIWSGFRCVRI